MKSIFTTYPDFHALPKGINRMLLASESFFFAEAYWKISEPSPTAASRFRPQIKDPAPRGPGRPFSLFGACWKN